MGAFSTKMQIVANNLITKLGNSCTLTKVTTGDYVPLVGETASEKEVFNTFSAPTKNISSMFGQDGINTNLAGFDSGKVSIPYLGVNETIDETWLYNDSAISTVEIVETQDEIVVFNITVASS